MRRCFGDGKPTYEKYHDCEWGRPVHDDRHLFEMLILEGAQAGLSWELILNRRADYRTAFHNFDPQKVAEMTNEELEHLRRHSSIVRNRLKIASARKNARAFLKIQEECGSFNAYIWNFVNGSPIINHWKTHQEVPCQSPISEAISKDLKKRGMSFVGPTIIYSFMQAVGMVNDHLTTCPERIPTN